VRSKPEGRACRGAHQAAAGQAGSKVNLTKGRIGRKVRDAWILPQVRARASVGARLSERSNIVAAFASTCPSPIVLTSGPGDLAALAEHTARPITIARG
jgi:hypothetical protein